MLPLLARGNPIKTEAKLLFFFPQRSIEKDNFYCVYLEKEALGV